MSRAGIGFDIQINPAQERALLRFSRQMPKQIPRVLSRAVNRTASPTAIKMIADEVGQEILLKKGSIKKRIRLQRRATPSEPSAMIAIPPAKSPSLASFRRPKDIHPRGVRVQVRADEPPQVLRHAFIRSLSGVPQILTREMPGGGISPRYPITVKRGPSVRGVFANEPGLAQRALRNISAALGRRVSHEINFELSRSVR